MVISNILQTGTPALSASNVHIEPLKRDKTLRVINFQQCFSTHCVMLGEAFGFRKSPNTNSKQVLPKDQVILYMNVLGLSHSVLYLAVGSSLVVCGNIILC